MSTESLYARMRRELTRAIVIETGTREQLATPYADAVLRWMQSHKTENGFLYVPKPPRQIDLLQISSALAGDKPIRQVCREHGVSRAWLRRQFPRHFLNR